MGCKSSVPEDSKKNGMTALPPADGLNNRTPMPSVDARKRSIVHGPAGTQEDKIDLIFKAKRANVFTQGITPDEQMSFNIKNIPKSTREESLIRKCFEISFLALKPHI